MLRWAYSIIVIALLLMVVGAYSVWTGHPDGNWLIAPGFLILMILGLAGGLGIGDRPDVG